MRIAGTVLTAFVLIAAAALPCLADDLRLDASTMFDSAVTRDVRPAPDGNAIILDSGVLIEDDGPAAGYSYKPNEERLDGKVRIRKQLVIDKPAANAATLLVSRGGKLQLWLNDSPVELGTPTSVGNYWQAYAIDPAKLRQGVNSFVLTGTGKVSIARADEFAAGSIDRPEHPGRSAKSLDGGRSWQATLGTQNNVEGEYYVRLMLEQHHAAGSLTFDVMDAGNLTGNDIGPPLTQVPPVHVAIEADTGEQTRVIASYRSGPTTNPDDATWSKWLPLEDKAATLSNLPGRYIQLAVELHTDDPRQTPRLTAVTVSSEADAAEGDWSEAVRMVEQDNPRVVRSSIPFQYEPFDRPELAQLRRQYELDKVVEGAADEFELITRLATWTSHQWSGMHLGEFYPQWNALKILQQHTDGRPVGGFCQQYNLVFLQACASFGIVGRAVSLGQGPYLKEFRSGHEVAEIWSNQHRKWVFVDADRAWYPADEETGEPLSLLELRQRQLDSLAGRPTRKVKNVRLTELEHPWNGPGDLPPFVELRLIPRSNFLEQQAPLPLNQGMQGWSWTGFAVWTDDEQPAAPIYGRRIRNRSNFQWTLNEAHQTLEALPAPGQIRVHLDTQTPGFETYMASIDDGEPRTVQSGFTWELKQGVNRLKVWPRNSAGRDGIPSSVVLEYEPTGP